MMIASDLDFDALKPINLDVEGLKPGSKDTPFSIFLWAVASGDTATAEAQITDDVEWGLMPYSKVLKGKNEVIPWLQAGATDQKRPITISNAATRDWGIFEYWNIGTVSRELIEFGNERKFPWPQDPNNLIGQQYKVAQCFIYHINADGKIDLIRQYLDAGSVWAQFK